jgi:hypothetical protein
MITPLTTKLLLPGYFSPHYQVDRQRFYNKLHAIKHCQHIGHQWPSYHVWEGSGSFNRPKLDFNQSVQRQCELISDTAKKVRLFYSGGKDSNLILHRMLENKSRLDEIAVYRRFPGQIDKISNEFDQFDLLSVTKKTLKQYDANVDIKFYDVLPQHYNHYSKNLDSLFFPYTDLDFFVHGVHTVAEIYPNILDNEFVNVLGHGMPYVNEQSEFYWLDSDFNLNQPDPYAINFFADPRNKDLAVNMAYSIRDFKSSGKLEDSKFDNYGNGEYENVNAFKNWLGFPDTGTVLDSKYDFLSVSTPNWLLTRKQIVLMANSQTTEIGRQTFDNFVNFYEDFSREFSSYFNDGTIYHKWIGSFSEKHKLLDL